MARYVLRDLVRVPSLISLLRLPLAAVFPFVAHAPLAALAVLLAAGATDVLDGWYARRFEQATSMGAVVDPITDKVFVASVVLTLVFGNRLEPVHVALMATRELGELPLVVWFASSRAARRRQIDETRANVIGKLATCMQFATVTSALFGWRYTHLLVTITAAIGAFAAAAYWRRAVRSMRRERGRTPSGGGEEAT